MCYNSNVFYITDVESITQYPNYKIIKLRYKKLSAKYPFGDTSFDETYVDETFVGKTSGNRSACACPERVLSH